MDLSVARIIMAHALQMFYLGVKAVLHPDEASDLFLRIIRAMAEAAGDEQ